MSAGPARPVSDEASLAGRIVVVGNTGWGNTIASLLSRSERDAWLITRSAEESLNLRASGVDYQCTELPEVALDGARMVVWAVPSQTMRANVSALAELLPGDACHVSVSKGLEVDTGLRMTQIIEEVIGRDRMAGVCALSGPNLAGEIFQGLPAASVVASTNEILARYVQDTLGANRFITAHSDDVVGVELAGALKNIVALGAGMMDGLSLGDNAKAAFIAFTWSEVIAFGVAMGAREETFYGLAGIGDVVATCVSDLSRNHRVGCEVARGRTLEEILGSMHQVAEGVHTARAVKRLADEMHIDTPIMGSIYTVLFEGCPVAKAVARFTGAVRRSG